MKPQYQKTLENKFNINIANIRSPNDSVVKCVFLVITSDDRVHEVYVKHDETFIEAIKNKFKNVYNWNTSNA